MTWILIIWDRFSEAELILINYARIFYHLEKHNDNVECLVPPIYLWSQNCPNFSTIQ